MRDATEKAWRDPLARVGPSPTYVGAACRRTVTTVLGVDARRPEAWIAVQLEDGSLASIRRHDTLEALLAEAGEAATVAVDVPIGHEDREGEAGGRRACDRAARQALGDHAERVFWTPPLQVFDEEDHEQAVELAEDRGWPAPEKPMFAGRRRLQAVNEAALADDRIVEVHPAVSYRALNEAVGEGGPLETYGRGPRATYERLQLLAEVGMRPARSLGGVGRMSPRDVLEASIAAWSAHRVARGEHGTLPETPPDDPLTGREVCIVY
jgi:predicted RNase H-like nuclease